MAEEQNDYSPSEEYDFSAADEDVELGLELPSTSAGAASAEPEYSFKVLTSGDIVQDMKEIIEEVNSIVQIPATTTRELLNYLKWDKGKLYETYYDGDQERLFEQAHVAKPFKELPVPEDSEGQDSKKEECGICLEEVQIQKMASLGCGHQFCSQCWEKYLQEEIMEKGYSSGISCGFLGCDLYVDDQFVFKIVKDPKVRLKYQQLITNSFVECNRLIRWCPKPDCANAVKVTTPEAKPVTCSCGTCFCFGCGGPSHDPVSCELQIRWDNLYSQEGETNRWLVLNTKPCPRCSSPIEKNGGCNHIVCKQLACGHEFCWNCFGPWETHGVTYFSCNRFEEESSVEAREVEAASRLGLERYMFYWKRFSVHQISLSLEEDLYESAIQRLSAMLQHNMIIGEVQFLRNAVSVLHSCRRILMNSYILAYYILPNNQSIIFEQNQWDLETATETLSGYLEREMTTDTYQDLRRNLQMKARYCENRRKVLLDHVAEGYEKDWWEIMDI